LSWYHSLPDRTAAAALALAGAGSVALLLFGIKVFVPFGLSLALLLLGQPLFKAYAMARPNARSSHKTPVPQGGGAPVIVATLVSAVIFAAGTIDAAWVALIGAGALLALTGAVDDVKGLPVLPRLSAQAIAVGLFVGFAPHSWRIFPEFMPLPIERLLLVLAGVWFVNLTNFMDGIDGITLAGFLPLAVAIHAFSMVSYASVSGGLIALCFAGAMLAFIPFNWHPARLFLGDVGSLPMGLIGGALLFDTAAHGGLVAAIILPLYHFADATLTLLKRLARREKVWEAHRQHAYQCAVDSGLSHSKVSGIVLGLNIVLAFLAWLSLGSTEMKQGLLLSLALLLVIGVIVLFQKRRVRH
jgi:UDP-N-acetylmuramyl pentapeptide phosphotransferase/UDP-N-acetylglucosamine-1-phosphate transferase